MVEDVRVIVQIVKALRRQNHAHIVPGIEQRQRAQEEAFSRDLVRVEDAHQLVAGDGNLLRQGGLVGYQSCM